MKSLDRSIFEIYIPAEPFHPNCSGHPDLVP